jgi:hypothetical protein
VHGLLGEQREDRGANVAAARAATECVVPGVAGTATPAVSTAHEVDVYRAWAALPIEREYSQASLLSAVS